MKSVEILLWVMLSLITGLWCGFYLGKTYAYRRANIAVDLIQSDACKKDLSACKEKLREIIK